MQFKKAGNIEMIEMKKKMTMLILSCDKFSDLWDGHVKQLETYWPDREMDTYIVTDKQSKKKYNNVNIFSAGDNVEWSDRLLKALDMVKTEYVFITLDDYFLIRPVSTSKISKLIEMMEQYDLDYVRLFKRPTKATREAIPNFPKAYMIDCGFKYSVNLYSGMWKTKFMKNCVAEPLDPWKFEVELPKMACAYGAKCAVSNNKDFVILDVVRKGKLLHNSHYYFKRHPGIYDGDRKVNSWGYELPLAIKTIVGRYTPMPVHNKIKKVMRKFGYQFFSE